MLEGGKRALNIVQQERLHTISIIIVTYNAKDTLQAALNSIYTQPYPYIELIIMDGNSSDGTPEILQLNNDKIDYWKSEDDDGIYYAMNKAVKEISGQWVFFMGADDVLLDDFSIMVDNLKRSHCIYYANVLYKDKKYSGLMSKYRQAKAGLFHQSIIYPASVFQKYRYHTKYRVFADYALNMALNKDKDYQFTYLDYTISRYNDTGISSYRQDVEFTKDKMTLIRKYFGLIIYMRLLFREIKSVLKQKVKK